MAKKKGNQKKLRSDTGSDMLNRVVGLNEILKSEPVDPFIALAPSLAEKKGDKLLDFVEDESDKKQLKNVIDLLEKEHPETQGIWAHLIESGIKSDFQAVATVLNELRGKLKTGYDPAEFNRLKADQFAINMGKHLEAVRKDGKSTMRDIADRFNELQIPSFHNKTWSHSTVMKLLHRRRDMGLE
ncbi:hypothetical protein BFP97_06295 [Roseivirga sp. 4D4]|uniref:recombinase family protein n=1 Tax=Roseivirga sp. 4D4 TaxID=1889784 RepID=UPI000852F76F|nr:recombinase family protein [Roseivirga sp. 4D4]OEK01141.1 hypothetical protein BFP97_06295 [Roseivirga sp. 4D4]